MDCAEIYVIESNLDSSHLNILLKHWVGGGFERLRVLLIRTRVPVVHNTTFHHLESKLTLVEREREYITRHPRNQTIPANTMDIKRNDGKVASVKIVGHFVVFLVWPDYSA